MPYMTTIPEKSFSPGDRDQTVRKSKELLGGNGYLAYEEYRQLHRNDGTPKESFKRTFWLRGITPIPLGMGVNWSWDYKTVSARSFRRIPEKNH